jgi:hypothetical protein
MLSRNIQKGNPPPYAPTLRTNEGYVCMKIPTGRAFPSLPKKEKEIGDTKLIKLGVSMKKESIKERKIRSFITRFSTS